MQQLIQQLTPETLESKLHLLKKELPFKWRVQSFSKNKPLAQCVAYIDARDVMNMFDDIVGPANWKDEYRTENNQLFCGVSIKLNGEWVTKWDVGTKSDMEEDKGQVSDAFKRAAVKWGVGRFLYDLDILFVKADAIKEDDRTQKKAGEVYSRFPNVVDNLGKKVYDLTTHCNKIHNQSN